MKKLLMMVSLCLLLACAVKAEVVAHWTMDKADLVVGDPNYYTDLSGSEHHAYAGGAPIFIDDVLGNPLSAVHLDGTRGWAEAGTFDPHGENGQMTANMWVRIADGEGGVVLSKRNSWDSAQMMWQINVNSNDIGWLHAPFNFQTITLADAAVELDQWFMLTMTSDRLTNQLNLYINGQLARTFSIGSAPGTDSMVNIGMSNITATNTANEPFIGDLDDVAIYDSILTATEVADLYRAVITAPTFVNNPQPTHAFLGETGKLTSNFSSVGSDLAITWYKVVGEIDETPGSGDDMVITAGGDITLDITPSAVKDEYQAIMTIANFEAADEAMYYCVVSDSGGEDVTGASGLYLKKLVAHYSLNSSDYTQTTTEEGLYADLSENGRDAVSRGQAAFVSGFDGLEDHAVAIDPNTSWADAGTWNPSESGQMTFSAWFNWSGQPSYDPPTGLYSRASCLIAKRNTWDTTDMMWQINFSGTNISVLRPLAALEVDYASVGVALNEWHQITLTHDTSTNMMVMYIDGEYATSGGFPMATGIDTEVRIGYSQLNMGWADESFTGSIDDVRFYNYAMTNKQVLDLYNDNVEEDKVLCLDSYFSAIDIAGPDTVVEDYTTFVPEPDCVVNLYDFMVFVNGWMTDGRYPAVN